MIKNKEEFFHKFTKVLPGQFDNNNQNLKEFSLYFDHFSKDAVEEMHRYSIDQSFYDHYEFDAFTSIVLTWISLYLECQVRWMRE